MTPTVLRIGPYRFFFYSGDKLEPPHVHIEKDDKIAKYWLIPVRIQSSGGFRPAETRQIQRLVEENQEQLLESWNEVGMSTLVTEIRLSKAQDIKITKDEIVVALVDGRTIVVPLVWYPRILNASEKERRNWRLIGNGEGIHWPDLDEDISVEHLLAGIPSGESQSSLQKWLQLRTQ